MTPTEQRRKIRSSIRPLRIGESIIFCYTDYPILDYPSTYVHRMLGNIAKLDYIRVSTQKAAKGYIVTRLEIPNG